MSQTEWTSIHDYEDVSDEILNMAHRIVDGWYSEIRIDWADFWDRLEGSFLNDGTRLDLGTDLDSPALKRIKRAVRDYRKLG